jgi:peptidoglycan/LPS O-acetylase OafA/YrhL
LNKTQRNWFEEVNYLRFIAIIGVLIIHTTDGTVSVHKLTGMTFTLIYLEELFRFAVPMFIFISGFVLHNKYRSDLPMREFYTKRFLVIYIPYIFFSLFYNIIGALTKNEGVIPYPDGFSSMTLNSIINSILNFSAAGHFWYIKLILTFYIFYPIVIAYYETIKKHFGAYTLVALFLSIIIMYLFGWFVYPLDFGLSSPLRFLIYFLLGIYVNDNYEQVSRSLERLSSKKVTLFSISIVSLPIISMFSWIDQRCGTQFTNFIPHYAQLIIISTAIQYIMVFVFGLYLTLYYKPKIRILKEIGEYSYGIFMIHGIFHILFDNYIFPFFSISRMDLAYYVFLFIGMLLPSYYIVKLMLTNYLTTYIITGKLNSH